jgi:molybdate transport system substrate-binding protein
MSLMHAKWAWVIAAAAALATVGCGAHPAPLRIAAAADLRFALDDVVKTFRQRRPDVQISPSYGSSGMFYQQLVNHAPFDLFLSADEQYPKKLAEQGLIVPGSEFHYANGRIVLWTANSTGLDVEHGGMHTLQEAAVRHIAIANPAHAPYGRAAEAALRSFGFYNGVKDRLVMGENIAQTFQMVQSGAAEVGIVALSLALAPGAAGQGHYWEVPPTAYPPIRQGGVILKWARNEEAAQALRSFLISPEGRAILLRYGFSGD